MFRCAIKSVEITTQKKMGQKQKVMKQQNLYPT